MLSLVGEGGGTGGGGGRGHLGPRGREIKFLVGEGGGGVSGGRGRLGPSTRYRGSVARFVHSGGGTGGGDGGGDGGGAGIGHWDPPESWVRSFALSVGDGGGAGGGGGAGRGRLGGYFAGTGPNLEDMLHCMVCEFLSL